MSSRSLGNTSTDLERRAQWAIADKMKHRRLIGRRFDDPTVKKDMESWPFKVVDDNGNPKVEVQYLGETKQFSPQEISAMVLTKVRLLISFRPHSRNHVY